jgi:uncharacterized membrane protein YGL010W
MSKVENLNKFQKLYVTFGTFHSSTFNFTLHCLLVPVLILGIDKLTDYYSTEVYKLPINPFHLGYLIIGAFSIYVDMFVGTLTTTEYIAISYLTRHYHFDLFGFSHAKVLGIALIVTYAILQFGHVFEGERKPTFNEELFVNISAPVFVNIQLLYLLGYRKGEILEAKKYIAKDMERWTAQHKKKE